MSDADDMAHASHLEYLDQKEKEELAAEFDALQRRVKALERTQANHTSNIVALSGAVADLEEIVNQLVHINDTGPHLLAQETVKIPGDPVRDCYCTPSHRCHHHMLAEDT